jgi:uncharacterized membrane protein
MRTPATKIAALAFFALALAVPLALAREVSRESYVAAVEPICKANTKANERILAGARRRVQKGQLAPAAAQFERAAGALERTLGELKAVPRPPADTARLGRWFADIEVEVGLFAAMARDLRAGQKARAEHLSVQLTSAANKANVEVLAFEFHSCRAEPSKFT